MHKTGRYVLVNNEEEGETDLQWRTKTIQKCKYTLSSVNLSYKEKKTLVSSLDPSLKTIATTTVSKRQLPEISRTKLPSFMYSCKKRNQQPSRVRTQRPSLESDSSMSSTTIREIVQAGKMAKKIKGRLVCVLSVRRFGLRFKFTHYICSINQETDHSNFMEECKKNLFPFLLKNSAKKIYFFHLGEGPINNICDLSEEELVVLTDLSPKVNLQFDVQAKAFEHASFLEEKVLENLNSFCFYQRSSLPIPSHHHYDWEKIGDIKKHADALIQNPELIRQHKEVKQPPKQLQQEEPRNQTPQFKPIKYSENPLLDVQSRFPQQLTELGKLNQMSQKIQKLPQIVNKHKFKKKPVENMLQKMKRQNDTGESLRKKQKQKERNIGYKSQKELLKDLDRKNLPLCQQNIPYIMQKYEINRAEAYNLYNIYKSLEKISGAKLLKKNELNNVVEKGIDRETFEEGMKGLEINPGQEIIRNICYFPEFISWQQFIKIVSISIRKTTESKLDAILEGMRASGSGGNELSKDQIGIMVGSSLNKMFGREQPELRQHFVGIVMRTLDEDDSGTIDIEQLKSHVYKRSLQDMDLVSYLLLNS